MNRHDHADEIVVRIRTHARLPTQANGHQPAARPAQLRCRRADRKLTGPPRVIRCDAVFANAMLVPIIPIVESPGFASHNACIASRFSTAERQDSNTPTILRLTE